MKRPTEQVQTFWRGFSAVLPFWLAAAPFALAYVVAARHAELSAVEIQLASLTIFSGAGQIALVQMLSDGNSVLIVVVSMVVLHAHFFLYGLSLSRQMSLTSHQKCIASFLLTDVAYGISIAKRHNHQLAFLLGAEMSMFMAWNLFTLLGIITSRTIPTEVLTHLEFIVPLTFFLLLVSSIASRVELMVAIIACVATLFCLSIGVGRGTLIIVGITAPLMGTLFSQSHPKTHA